jgi:hypothetical protein
MLTYRFSRLPVFLVLLVLALAGCTRDWSDSTRVVVPLDEPTIEIVVLPGTSTPDPILFPPAPTPTPLVLVVEPPEPQPQVVIVEQPVPTPVVIVVEPPTPTPFIFYVTATPNTVVLLPQTGADLTARPAAADFFLPVALIGLGLAVTLAGFRFWRR